MPYLICYRGQKVLYPAPVILSSVFCPIRRDRARKCGHGLQEGGQPRFLFQLLLVVPAQPIKIASDQAYRTNTTFCFELKLSSLPAITLSLLAPSARSRRAQTAWRLPVASPSIPTESTFQSNNCLPWRRSRFSSLRQ